MYPFNRRIVAATFALVTVFLVHASGASLSQDEIIVSEGTAVKVITTSENNKQESQTK